MKSPLCFSNGISLLLYLFGSCFLNAYSMTLSLSVLMRCYNYYVVKDIRKKNAHFSSKNKSENSPHIHYWLHVNCDCRISDCCRKESRISIQILRRCLWHTFLHTYIWMEDNNICALRIYTQPPQSEWARQKKWDNKNQNNIENLEQTILDQMMRWRFYFCVCARLNGCYNEIKLIVWCVRTDCVCCRFRLFSSSYSCSFNSFFRSKLNIIASTKMHAHNFPCHAIGYFSLSLSTSISPFLCFSVQTHYKDRIKIPNKSNPN